MNKPILTDEQMTRITSIVEEIEKLSDIEKLLLYLHLPGGTPSDTDSKYPEHTQCPAKFRDRSPSFQMSVRHYYYYYYYRLY